jgi:uncharacterized membrane protein
MAEIPDRRFAELDGCRGIAIFMMVLFHLVFDLSFFSLYPVDVQHGFWRYFGYTTASLFVLIAGIAIMIRGCRIPPGTPFLRKYIPFLKRGIFLILIGTGITLATYIFLQGEGYVVFGILHLIGLATILAPFFFRLKQFVLIPGGLLILAGWCIPLPHGPLWLVFAGIHPPGFFSVDYTPLIPWLGVFFAGMAAGSWLYPGGTRSFHIPDQVNSLIRIPAVPGRHSLGIYLIHQPILLAILFMVSGKIPGF